MPVVVLRFLFLVGDPGHTSIFCNCDRGLKYK